MRPYYRMTIQFSLGGLSFVLFDTANMMVNDLELHQSDSLNSADELFRTLERDLNTRDLLDAAFQSVTCLIDGRTNTLVPETLYRPDDEAKLLGFNFDIPNNYVIKADRLNRLHAYNLYGYPEELRRLILAKWPQAKILHSTSVFLESLPLCETPTIFVNVRNRDFDMAIMADRLLFFNNFKFQTKVDFSYYLLYAMQQHHLSGLESTVWFSGLIQPSSEIIELCRRYLRDIRFVDKPRDLNIKETLREVPIQYFYNQYQLLK